MKCVFILVLSLTACLLGTAKASSSSSSSSSSSHLQGATLEGLSSIAVLTGVEAGQAALVLYDFLIQNEYVVDPSPLPPCFIEERIGDNENSGIDFTARLVEDYRSALGYSSYLGEVREYFSASLNKTPNCVYCTYLADVERTVDIMKHSLANLVRFINKSAFQSVTPPPTQDTSDQSPGDTSQDKGGVANGGSDSALPLHCSNPCYVQQARIYLRLEGFATNYISTDVTGYKQHA